MGRWAHFFWAFSAQAEEIQPQSGEMPQDHHWHISHWAMAQGEHQGRRNQWLKGRNPRRVPW